jgi:hypothetical protein
MIVKTGAIEKRFKRLLLSSAKFRKAELAWPVTYQDL